MTGHAVDDQALMASALMDARRAGPPAPFFSISGLDFAPGPKRAGFTLSVEPEAFIELARLQVAPAEQVALMSGVRERLARSGLVSKRWVESSHILFWGQTLCPRVFTTDPAFGASIGCEPESFGKAGRDDAVVALWPSVDYSPHNTDTAKQALALLVMVHAWADCARDRLWIARRAAK